MSGNRAGESLTEIDWTKRQFETEYVTLWLVVEEIQYGENYGGKYVCDAFRRYKQEGLRIRRKWSWYE